MMDTKLTTKIEFAPITPKDKSLFDAYFSDGRERGCEFSFANLCLWGEQSFALLYDHIVFLSRYEGRFVYPFPIGRGDKKAVLDAVLADAATRGLPCHMTGIYEAEKETIEALYPGRFRFFSDPGSFDYVYAIDDLADLRGKRYHGKRNHFNRFRETFPQYSAEPITEENLDKAKEITDAWYREHSENDYHSERQAIEGAFRSLRELELEGLVLLDGDRPLAMTLASRMSEDTFDVHFEKARADADGAYAAINCEFARYIRSKYPSVRYLNREEDMGIEGLRRAKESYHPHHMIRKYRAFLLEDSHEN